MLKVAPQIFILPRMDTVAVVVVAAVVVAVAVPLRGAKGSIVKLLAVEAG